MSGDEEWVKAAMINDTMVVELLVRLNQSQYPPPPEAVKQLKWSVRQRRSRPKPDTGASPTTPLSWSGGGAASLSGGCGDREESSHSPPPKLAHHKRSKVNNNSEKLTIKRSRKKKTLTELKEEEDLLLKERRELKREISALRVNLEKQRATNDSLKRIKMEMQLHPEQGTTIVCEATISGRIQEEKIESCHPILSITPPPIAPNNIVRLQLSSDDSPEPNAVAAPMGKFMLPDLNIVFDEEPGCEVS